MPTYKSWTLMTEDLEEILNTAKDVLLADLARCGIIPEDQVEELSKTKVMMVKEKGRISRFFRRLLKKNEKEDPSILVGTLHLEESDGDEKSQDQNEASTEAPEKRD